MWRRPSSLFPKKTIKHPSCWTTYVSRAAWFCGALGGTLLIVDLSTDHSLIRFWRAMDTVARIVMLYKYSTPKTPVEYLELHRRSGELMLNLCLKNEGFYIKLGQGLNSMTHLLPREFTSTLSVLLDEAGPVSFTEIQRCIKEETGKEICELFERFEEKPVASASIAQVHRAWIKPRDKNEIPQEVAVKVQRPCIRHQAPWDLAALQVMSFAAQYLFSLPTEWARKTIVDGLKSELDFKQEALNAQLFRSNFSGNKHIYIPKVYDGFTTSRLMVLEWVNGTKLLDVDVIRTQFNEKKVLKALFECFSDMVFKHKFMHSDPHGANVLVRHLPEHDDYADGNSRNDPATNLERREKRCKEFQLVLLDFGLCVPISEKFRMQYALFLKSFISRDMETIGKIVRGWGINDEKAFLTIHMQKPLRLIEQSINGEVTKEEMAAMRQAAHARIKRLLKDDSQLPPELPLFARGFDILRSNSRMYGSPINYIKVMASSALDCLGPLHDYEGVQQYLQRIQQVAGDQYVGQEITATRPMRQDTGKLQPDRNRPAPHSCHDEKGFLSVYDDEAKQQRLAQSLAVGELDAERKASLYKHFKTNLVGLYQSIKFYVILLRLDLIHYLVHYYNLCLNIIAPSQVMETLKMPSLDELLDDIPTVY